MKEEITRADLIHEMQIVIKLELERALPEEGISSEMRNKAIEAVEASMRYYKTRTNGY